MSGPRSVATVRRLFADGRLILSLLAGGAIFAMLPETLRLPMRIALSWIGGVTLFLLLTALVVAGASPEQVRRRARQQDSRAWVILAIIVTAAAVSLIALGFTLQKQPSETALALAARLVIAGFTVAASWTLVHTMFALRYAHHYYGDGPGPGQDDDRGGLTFPGNGTPDYWDFLYFSFVIGMTCQVSDVQVTSQPTRRIALIHGVLSFFFNTVILALSVNLLAGSL